MSSLPDFEGLAVFAKVVELRSFSAAAADLQLSKATVSKAVSRLEARLAARLLNRTSRRLSLTDAGLRLAERASALLAEAEAAESECLEKAAAPRGPVRLAAPMSYGLREVAPLMPAFFARFPEISVDLHLSDAIVDLVGEGFDAALRIGALSNSSLIARRLLPIAQFVVAAPSYLDAQGRPLHPQELQTHACLGYAYLQTPDLWRFSNAQGETSSVRPKGPLRATNGDALMPALLAGQGVAVLPEFIVGEALAQGRLERILVDWSPPTSALHLVTPAGGPRPARVTAMTGFLAARLSRAAAPGEGPARGALGQGLEAD
jgi:DNA-binding transcriptional LysR family regulator